MTSSAFDTIDHSILVHRLHADNGFSDTVLQWFSSYLTDRTHYVFLSNHCSASVPANTGVLEDSFFCDVLFCMCIKSLSIVIHSHYVTHYSRADDLQLQIRFFDQISMILHSIQSCISDIKG